MKSKILKNMDWGVLICTILLVTIGLIALFSTTRSSNYDAFIKQLTWFRNKYSFFISCHIY